MGGGWVEYVARRRKPSPGIGVCVNDYVDRPDGTLSTDPGHGPRSGPFPVPRTDPFPGLRGGGDDSADVSAPVAERLRCRGEMILRKITILPTVSLTPVISS